jgi:formylglycine-generating enzyme
MKLKKIFLIFIELALFSSVLTAESDYDYLLNKYKTIIEKKREKAEAEREKKAEVERLVAERKKIISDEIVESIFVNVPNKNYSIMATEVTQKQYEAVMGENPSNHKGDDLPVENVSWYDAIYFCNKLSLSKNLEPVYSVNGKTDVTTWNYTPHQGNSISGDITQNTDATGYRLPTLKEWRYAAKGGENYNYAGSDNLDELGWYNKNSNDRTHPVAQKKPNGYGLYDMSGNVCEWVWDSFVNVYRSYCGGSYDGIDCYCEVGNGGYGSADDRYYRVGFRLVCPSK